MEVHDVLHGHAEFYLVVVLLYTHHRELYCIEEYLPSLRITFHAYKYLENVTVLNLDLGR